MKGQASMETMVTLGIVLAFTVPVILLLVSFTSVTHEDTSIAQADAAARSLADSMNFVYIQGDGAKRSVILNVPASTEEIVVQDRTDGRPGGEVIIRIRTSSGRFDAVAPTLANVSYSIYRDKSGLFTMQVVNSGGEVMLVDPPQ